MPNNTAGVVLVLAYLFPALLAAYRKHPQINPIAVVTIFLGWTFVGWVVALAWAASAFEHPRS